MYKPTVSNGRITGFVVEFSDSDACGEFHGGTLEENRTNAITFESAKEMAEALGMVEAAFRLAEASTPANLRRAITMLVRPALTKLEQTPDVKV